MAAVFPIGEMVHRCPPRLRPVYPYRIYDHFDQNTLLHQNFTKGIKVRVGSSEVKAHRRSL
ncbi:hypothetical protein HanRHA438_Chr04g0181681 [Helianthus annuus]|nr:hypothetical protein HanRHA438_Chr04g0181681 [Helianthus annuus]